MRKLLFVLGLFLLMPAGCKDDDPAPVAADCPAGTVKWTNGHCYQAVLAPGVSWAEAQAACSTRGGHLATVNSAEENAFLFSLVSGDSAFWVIDAFNNGLGPWLGGFQATGAAEPGGGWGWVTGEPFSYTNWERGQPDDAGTLNQNRLRFFKAGALIGSGWDDFEADNWSGHRRGYLFERE